METQNNRTLASIINPTPQQQQGQDSEMQTYNTFLTVFSINCVHRFPDVLDLNAIDYDTVKGVSQFSVACANIAQQTWGELRSTFNGQKTQRLRSHVSGL